MIVWIAIMLGSVLLDQGSKWLVVTFLDRNEPFVLWEGVFRFTYVENTGAAFGMLSDHRWVFLILSTVAIVALLVYLWKWPPESKWACAAIAMIAGGGLGNMIDRIFRVRPDGTGYVVDFLDFYLLPDLWQWVFNVADCFVCVGAAILFVWCIVSLIAECKQKKPTATEETTPVATDDADPQ